MKARLPQYRRKKAFFAGYLAKFMFLRRCQYLKCDPTLEFFKAAGRMCDPTKNSDEIEDGDTVGDETEGEDDDFDLIIESF